ncbi:hypothetical protein [Amycolatopsis solani]|uniref:hypothetical protein n=1 Tax=Amycolatopsis solani TaxID=3028615 RepID=UPI0025B1FE37|nr:hypothetical protein [Amycolatopsis sp. MEP2-6]
MAALPAGLCDRAGRVAHRFRLDFPPGFERAEGRRAAVVWTLRAVNPSSAR